MLRHDTAHVLATAVLDLWPGTKVSIGPPIADGFYYDFEFPDGFRPSDADLERIEERWLPTWRPTSPSSAPRPRPPRRSSASGREEQPYKVELIEDLVRDEGTETVSLYRNGPFVDLCRGPHGPSTGRIKAFKLNSVAGAYWRGDENRQMLTRIYGTAFFSEQGPGGAPGAARAGAGARPPAPRPAAGPVHAAARCAGDAVLASERDRAPAAGRARGAAAARARRLLGDQDPAGARRGALASLGALGQLRGEHVLHRRSRTAGSRSSR